MAQPTKVFVGSLPPGTKPEELRHLFENYGIVVECDVMNRCGFVHMKNAAMAESAIGALNASEFKGQTIVVEHGRPKERKQMVGGGGGGGAGGRAGNQNGPRGGRGGGMGRMLVGFPRGQNSNSLNQAATLQLAGIVMELLGDQQNQIDDISGGNNNMRGGGGGGGNDHGFRRGGGPQGGAGNRGGNFQGGNRGGNKNMNGVGPMRNQGFKQDRPAPYPQGMNMGGGPTNNMHQGGSGGMGGGRFNNQGNNYQTGAGMGGRGSSGPGGNFHRGGNFAPKPQSGNFGGGNNSWNNDQRGGGMPPQQGGRNFADDNFTGGFSGNMGNSSGGNFGGQQDRRGFALPSNQFQQYGSSGNKGGGVSGFVGNDVGVPSFNDEVMFQRRNNNQPNIGDGNFNRSGNQGGRGAPSGGPGGFQNNRGGQQGFQQQGDGFKRGGPGGNMMNSGANYQQNFPPLGGGNQGGFGNKRFPGGQGGRGGGGGGGGNMNRNAPRQNMPNRRY